MPETYIVCYVDINSNTTHYIEVECTQDEIDKTIDDIRTKHKLTHVFNLKNDEIRKAKDEERSFNALCRVYGFEPEDYQACFRQNGKIYRIIGFLPQNVKYKVRLFDETNGKYIKATVSFVKTNLDKCRRV